MSASDPTQMLPTAECLRTPDLVDKPDPRTSYYWGQNPPSLELQHQDIEAIKLNAWVPEQVAIQFETARNLYLYAWHVYRFYMVAEMQAFSTLEFGLREKLPKRLPAKYQRPDADQPTLFGLLNFAIDQGLICNEGFKRWHEVAAQKAHHRQRMDVIQTMIDGQLDELEIDGDAPLVIKPEDQSWDLVAILRKTLHKARNARAHGGSELTRQVLGTIELIAEILNQVYAQHLSMPSQADTIKGPVV
jgi:hypothetical protein